MSDLTEAAATVLSKPSIANKYDNAAYELATWAAKMLDETPIDESWLRSVGFREYGMFIDGYGGHEGGLTLDGSDIDFHCLREWRINGRGIGGQIKTRGQLRMLCQAIGIELKEQA